MLQAREKNFINNFRRKMSMLSPTPKHKMTSKKLDFTAMVTDNNNPN